MFPQAAAVGTSEPYLCAPPLRCRVVCSAMEAVRRSWKEAVCRQLRPVLLSDARREHSPVSRCPAATLQSGKHCGSAIACSGRLDRQRTSQRCMGLLRSSLQAALLSSRPSARQPAVHCFLCCETQSLCSMPGSERLLEPRQIILRGIWAASSPCSLSLCQQAERALPTALQLQAVLLHDPLQGGEGCLVPAADHCVQGVPPPPGCHIVPPSAAVEGVPLQPGSSALACKSMPLACISFECMYCSLQAVQC